MIWSADVSAWRKLPGDLSIEGMMDAIIGKTFPLPSYITAEDKKAMTDVLLGGGLTAPTCYYKVQLNGGRREDDRSRFFEIYSLETEQLILYLPRKPFRKNGIYPQPRALFSTREVPRTASASHPCKNRPSKMPVSKIIKSRSVNMMPVIGSSCRMRTS